MEQRGFVFHTENLSSPADAVATFLAHVSLPLPSIESVPLEDARGRVLARNVVADADYPSTPRSAMDGFAIRSAEVPGRLRVVGEIAMGTTWPNSLGRGEAVRIPTGGAVPRDADAVVAVEDARLDGTFVEIPSGIESGENVSPAGSDMRTGDAVVPAGIRIAASQLGLFATLGMVEVPVYCRPRIGVLSSGDELVPPGADPRPGQVRDSNRYAIGATLAALGAEPLHLPTVSDEPGALEASLARALERVDAVVLTGGSSVGERDRTPDAIASVGGEIVVHGLRVKPGKPTVFAHRDRRLILGLPGNPTSSVMILQAVAAPLIAKLCGYDYVSRPLRARLRAAIATRAGWTWYVPVMLKEEASGFAAHPLPLRSSTVSLLARADGYVLVPPERETIGDHEDVEVHRLL